MKEGTTLGAVVGTLVGATEGQREREKASGKRTTGRRIRSTMMNMVNGENGGKQCHVEGEEQGFKDDRCRWRY